MEEKKLDELVEGMITMKDVYFGNKQVLIARRTILTDQSLALMAAHRIGSVCVSEDINFVQRFKDINERIDKRFEAYRANSVMQSIASVAKKYFKENLKKSFE